MEKFDINSSEHANRDPYAVEGDALTFPERLIELYLSDLLEEHDIAYTVRKGRARVRINPAGQLKSRSGEFTTLTKDDLRQAQIEAFYAKCAAPLTRFLAIHHPQRVVPRAPGGRHLPLPALRPLPR